MKKTMGFRLAVGVVALALPGSAVAQTVATGSCPAEEVRPDLGISGLDCVGECTLTLDAGGRERLWRFSVEPRIMGVREGSPAEGRLRAGDRLVAVDGSLITTQEAGRRFANLSTGETVRIRFRREGRVDETTVRVGSRCHEGIGSDLVGRVAPPAAPASPAAPQPDVVTAPRVVYRPSPRPPEAPAAPRDFAPSLPSAPSLPAPRTPPTPTGRLGAGFRCGQCGMRWDSIAGGVRWFFSAPLEITNVEAGGPADRAGIQVGDLIAAVDGAAIESEAGGAAFSAMTPGEAVNVTVVRRDGRRAQVRVVPVEQTAPAAPVAPAEPAAPAAVSPSPARPPRGVSPAETVGAAQLPLSFVGSIAGVEVEVRGGPVQVSEFRGERTLVINAGGTWIRIKVPAEGGR